MRRLAALFLVVALVGVAAFWAARGPVSVELELNFGAMAPAEATLVFTREDLHIEREIKLLHPGARQRRTLRLPRGRYTVGARLQGEGPSERTLSRLLEIDQAGIYTLDLN